MNNASNYINKRLKSVTLSTGDIIRVRPLSKSDYLSLGEIPAALFSEEGIKELTGGNKERQAERIVENLPFFTKLLNHVVTSCVVSGLKIVAKDLDQCKDGEVPISVLADEDQSLILAAVMGASGVSSGAVATANPFPQEPAAAGNP